MHFENPKALTMTLNQLLGNTTFAGSPLSEGVWDYLGYDKYKVTAEAVLSPQMRWYFSTMLTRNTLKGGKNFLFWEKLSVVLFCTTK